MNNTHRLQAIDAILAELPRIECRRLCQQACGPLMMSRLEQRRIESVSGLDFNPMPMMQKLITTGETQDCPALVNGACSQYAIRPAICFLPNSWVFTKDGPKFITDIMAGDQVYGKDGNLHAVVATNSRLYNGKICNVRLSASHIECWSTADHQWLCATQKDKRKRPSPEWVPAISIRPKRQHQTGSYLTFPKVYQDNNALPFLNVEDYVRGRMVGDMIQPLTSGKLEGREQQSIQAILPITEEFLFMIGIFLAEGSSSYQHAIFSMHVRERYHLERISTYLQSIGLRTTISGERNSLHLQCSSCLLGRLLGRLCGKLADHKGIDEKFFGLLSNQQKMSIFNAWEIGDGHTSKTQRSITSASEKLAMQMVFIAFLNSLFPHIYKIRPTARPGSAAFALNLFPSNWRNPKPGHGAKNMYDEKYIYAPVWARKNCGIEVKEYHGPVIDIEVEDSESFVTSSGIAHNCHLWGLIDHPLTRCPHGCVPERWVTNDEGHDILRRINKLGGAPPS